MQIGSSCRLLIVPLFRGRSRFENLILSHHSRFTCECNTEDINDDVNESMFEREQLKAQGPSRTCNESKEEVKKREKGCPR